VTKAASEFSEINITVETEASPCIGFLDEDATVLSPEVALLFLVNWMSPKSFFRVDVNDSEM